MIPLAAKRTSYTVTSLFTAALVYKTMKIKRYILTISSRLRTCEDQDYEMEILFSVQSAMAMLKKYNTIMRSYGLYGSQPCTPLLSTGLSANEGLDPAVLPSHWPSPPAVQKSPPRPWGRDANILSLSYIRNSPPSPAGAPQVSPGGGGREGGFSHSR